MTGRKGRTGGAGAPDSASTVVFVHGLIGSLQVPDLLQYFPAGRALAPDLLGYGSQRDVAPDEITVSGQVEYLRRTIDEHVGAEPVHLVGHSVGGLVVMLFAHAYPERVKGIVNVEGNFTLNDAFWSASVARMHRGEAESMLAGFRSDPEGWLGGSGIAASPRETDVARRWLDQQPATTVQAMARTVLAESGVPEYMEKLREVFARHPVHLVCGERSETGWDVPAWARTQAASYTVLPGTGHLMMLERPAEFAAAVRGALDEGV